MKKTTSRLYGLIGYPVKHSFSAAMHNAAFRTLKLNAEYRLFELRPQALKGFLKGASSHNIAGLNVTIPYKETAAKYLNWRSNEVKATGAVNTIKVLDNGNLKGFNTDGPGFSRDLEEKGFKSKGKNIAILGAGGAAKAVCFALAANKPKSIKIYDIDKNKAKDLIRRIKKVYPKLNIKNVKNIKALDIKKVHLLVNATPVGMKPSDSCLVKPSMLHSRLFVYDLIYNPSETKLLKLAKQKKAKVSNGLGMLFHQGVLSFQHWTGIKLSNKIQKIMWEALAKQVK